MSDLLNNEVIQDNQTKQGNYSILEIVEDSDWECLLFGSTEGHGISWTPVKGKEPNAFWRFMQYICFGNHWVKK